MYHQYTGLMAVRGGGLAGARRGKRATSSKQTDVYPFCSTEQHAIACILYIHDNASKILANVTGPLAPVVNVSCADTLRDILARSGTWVFEPDARCKHLPNAKAHLHGFCIDLYNIHSFTTSTRVLTVEPAGSYQAQLHLHDGEGRFTLDPLPVRSTDMSSRKSISHPFAYHGLPYVIHPVFIA